MPIIKDIDKHQKVQEAYWYLKLVDKNIKPDFSLLINKLAIM